MEYKTVRSFFTRFNKEKLFKICVDNELAGELKKSSCTKDYLSRLLVEHALSGKFSLRKLEILDLLHYHSSTNKKWNVYELQGKGKDKQFVLNDPEEFEELMDKELKSYLNCKVCVLAENNMLLARISVWNENPNLLLLSTTSIYMIHIPGSSHVLLSTVKAAYRTYFYKALENLFGCENLKEIDLTGKKVGPLCDLVLNKSSQGSFSHFRLNQVDENPLSRKRKRDSGEDSDIENNPKTFNEEWKKDQKIKTQTLKTFGSNPQPSLEKIEFKMSTRFKAGEYVPELADSEETVNCFVRFKGTNVLEGIQKLCEHGLASQPLPSHMRNIHSLSRNYFILTDKKRPKEN